MGEIVTSPRLQAERDRLYRPEADGRVRALVLALARPADWAVLGRVWQGVQTDLGWPAPGIAVSGTDACQLWFSLAEPVPLAEGHALLERLRTRYLADVPAHRVALWPSADGAQQAPHIPAAHGAEAWSAYVAPDLAPVFAETPWLDIAPRAEGQAELLARLTPISAAEYQAARPAPAPLPAAGSTSPGEAPVFDDPRAFLRHVMNDAGLDMALRIEAARALLAGG